MKQHHLFFIFAFACIIGNAQNVTFTDMYFKGSLVNHVPRIDTDMDGEIQFSEALAVTNLELTTPAADLTGLNAFSNLTSFTFSFNSNPGGSVVTSLDVSGLPNLQTLICRNNSGLSTVNVSGLTNLTKVEVSHSGVYFINTAGAVNLQTLVWSYGSVNPFFLTQALANTPHLRELDCRWNSTITSLNLSNNPELERLFCSNCSLNALDLSVQPNLNLLQCEANQIAQLDLTNHTRLNQVNAGSNPLTSIDFSAFEYQSGDIPLANYNVTYCPNLQYINAKVGLANNPGLPIYLYLEGCQSLRYICANESMVQNFISRTWEAGLQTVQVNSYCSFNPGGSYNTIDGNVSFDLGNGCGANAALSSNIRLRLDDGTTSGTTFASYSGHYSFPVGAGDFTITPELENPYFTATPESATVNFTTVDSAVEHRHFCLTPQGIHHDLEITLLPILGARPGFDATYRLVYKNKGNQIESGNINLSFDDAVLDLVSSNPAVSNQMADNLSWDFSNMAPFETRVINFTMNVNSPMETPAVNIGYGLNYIATINPETTDETPTDNISVLKQIVVGSLDPNDKTCLEGSTIAVEQVGKYLHYLIRFQNSGTAAAENIVVKDIIDTAKFDMASLQLTETSHPATIRIDGSKVEFIFEGINLPAESSDEQASHGFAAFKIKTKNDLVVGNSVSNKADIYFDYNWPIATDPAVTTVSLLAKAAFEDKTVSVFPNPAKDKITVTAKDKITSIQLFDLQGRLVHTTTENSSNVSINLNGKSNGIYFVKVHTAKGVKTEKIIKE